MCAFFADRSEEVVAVRTGMPLFLLYTRSAAKIGFINAAKIGFINAAKIGFINAAKIGFINATEKNKKILPAGRSYMLADHYPC